MPDAETQEALAAGDARMTTIEQQIAELRTELATNTALTQDIRDVLETGKALFRLGGWLAKIGAWLAPIIAAAAAVFAVWKTGGKR